MKRIEFIAPVEAMRGNLSGAQKLTYPTKDNSAWDAPTGKQNGATNYQPRYIGSRRSKDGRKGFSVRTRNTINVTPVMRTNMALLGTSSVIANEIMMNLAVLDALQALYLRYRPEGWSMKRWVQYKVRMGLVNKDASFTFDESGAPTVVIDNPFVPRVDDQAKASNISYRDFFKFWTTLGRVGSVVVDIDVEGKSKVQATFLNGVQFNDQFPQIDPVQFLGVKPNEYVFRNGDRVMFFGAFQPSNPSEPAAAIVIIIDDELVTYKLMKRPAGDTETAWTEVDWTDTCDTEQYDYYIKKQS